VHARSQPLRPERVLLGIREGLRAVFHVRPGNLDRALNGPCGARDDIVAQGCDNMTVGELIGGISFGERAPGPRKHHEEAYHTECNSSMVIEGIAKFPFGTAQMRIKNVISLDKPNLLERSRLGREVGTGRWQTIIRT